MSPQSSFLSVASCPLLAIVPIVHSSAVFAGEVRRAIVEFQPEVIALEFPAEAASEIVMAINALPVVHLVAFRREGTKDFLLLATDPCDGRIEAARLAMENHVDLAFIDVADAARNVEWMPLPDDQTAARLGGAAYAKAFHESEKDCEPKVREGIMAGRLARLAETRRTLAVISVRHTGAILQLLNAESDPDRFPLAEPQVIESLHTPLRQRLLPHLLGEMPYVTLLFENWRRQASAEETFDVLAALAQILKSSEEVYSVEYDESINLTEWRAIYQYGRNLSLVRGHFRPRLYELVTAARGCVDDDYGAIVLECATEYHPNATEEDRDEDLSQRQSLDIYVDVGDGLNRGVPAYPQPELTALQFHFKRRRPTPEQKQRWQREFLNSWFSSICSWPPEDERIEKFFDFLRKRALQSISADHTRVEEFQSSVLDGLDVRETMRNWHTKKLYVRRERKPPGRVGPVVLLWRDYPLDHPGLWRSTLYAENQNESDISIFCNTLGRDMIGPQIARTEYHGIMSVYPARGIPDVWRVAELQAWETCGRLLLASAILMCEEKFVAWVAEDRPAADLRALARKHRISIIHLPLAGFSRKTLKRLRQVHILGNHDVRGWAGDYITE